MKNKFIKPIILILILIFGVGMGIILTQDNTAWTFIRKQFNETYVKFDDTKNTDWDKEFKVVEIKSQLDDNIQKAYFYESKSNKPEPLIISLHTWSGYYFQNDELAKICKQNKSDEI